MTGETLVWAVVVALVAMVSFLIISKLDADDKEDCNRRGGVIHCAKGDCGCYWPDGRVLIR